MLASSGRACPQSSSKIDPRRFIEASFDLIFSLATIVPIVWRDPARIDSANCATVLHMRVELHTIGNMSHTCNRNRETDVVLSEIIAILSQIVSDYDKCPVCQGIQRHYKNCDLASLARRFGVDV